MPRHATDSVSLVFGTIFAGCTVVWVLSLTGAVAVPDLWLAGPIILIVAGVFGLLAALRPSAPDPES